MVRYIQYQINKIGIILNEKFKARHVSESDQETFTSTDGSIESRFLTPAAYEGLGRLFALHSELASCHACSPSYPNQATECCYKGYAACCIANTVPLISGT